MEVYFDELGWVPFDPTPIAAGRAVDLAWAPRAGTQDSADAEPGRAGAHRADDGRGTPDGPRRRGRPAGLAGTGRRTDALAPVLAGAGLALLVAGRPGARRRCVRVLQRRRRVADGTAGALWDELTATALDLGVRLNPARTPRQTAGELVALLARSGAGAPAAEAVQRLAREEEAASYGREGSSAAPVAHPDSAPALRTVRRAMLRSVSRRSRLLARLVAGVADVRRGDATGRARPGAARRARAAPRPDAPPRRRRRRAPSAAPV